MSNIKLSKRLQIIADFVPQGSSVADIGTDHGYVPLYLALNNHCSKIIASDINEAPLDRAISLAAEYGIDCIEFRIANGLQGMANENIDTVIIAGMGGENIADILSSEPWALDCRLILQPMSKRECLISWIREKGLMVAKEKLVKEKGGIHSVLLVQRGDDGDKSKIGLYISKSLIENGDKLLSEHISRLIKKAEKVRISLEESNTDDVRAKIYETLDIITALNDIMED